MKGKNICGMCWNRACTHTHTHTHRAEGHTGVSLPFWRKGWPHGAGFFGVTPTHSHVGGMTLLPPCLIVMLSSEKSMVPLNRKHILVDNCQYRLVG